MRKFIATVMAIASAVSSAQASQIWLTMDQVRPYTLEKPAQSIVVGNPGIADVTVRDNNHLLLFGKAPGLTNIYIFDEAGEVVENLVIRVRSPSSDMLVVHRGIARTTYNCTVNCEATITVGDDKTTFKDVAEQVGEKFSQAQSSAGDSN